MGDIKRGSET